MKDGETLNCGIEKESGGRATVLLVVVIGHIILSSISKHKIKKCLSTTMAVSVLPVIPYFFHKFCR